MLPSSYVNNMATLGPLGYMTKAPGTIGSIVGAFWYIFAFYNLATSYFTYLLIVFICCYFAIAICGEAEKRLQMRDPGIIILDEFVAMPVCFIGIPIRDFNSPIYVIIAGFLLFRVFDIYKPFGISRLQNLPEGTGVVMDDIGAALVTCVCLHVGIAWLA
jgi:phosphatidylglycerophosphatase A